MRRSITSLLLAGSVGCAVLGSSSSVEAFEYRRPGLVGPYTDRRMTNPVNAMTIIGGPGSGYTFGQRYDNRSIEGGFEYGQHVPPVVTPETEEVWTRFGIAFGLLPYLDAGAVFLNFKFAPNFDFTEVLVYITQAINLGDLELGVRLSFLTPGRPRGWQFNPALLAVYRGGFYRLEAGAHVPIGAGSAFFDPDDPDAQYVGLNVPVRGIVNVTPKIFTGLETGMITPRFDQAERTALPLGFLLGYTLLNKSRMLDLTASFKWDEFAYFAPPTGADAINAGDYRFNIGISMHKMAVPPPR